MTSVDSCNYSLKNYLKWYTGVQLFIQWKLVDLSSHVTPLACHFTFDPENGRPGASCDYMSLPVLNQKLFIWFEKTLPSNTVEPSNIVKTIWDTTKWGFATLFESQAVVSEEQALKKRRKRKNQKKKREPPGGNGVSFSLFYLIKSTRPFLSQSKIVILGPLHYSWTKPFIKLVILSESYHHQQRQRIWKQPGVEYLISIIIH